MTQNQPIRFKCPKCEAQMRAIASEAGSARKCPKCNAKFRIPKPGSKPRAATAANAKSKASVPPKLRARKPKKKQEDLAPVVCGVCNTRVYAKLSQVGSTIECPDCYTQNMVKPPEKEKVKKGPPAMMGDGYGLAPQQEIKIVDTMGKEKLKEAEVVVEKEIQAAPKMPDKPFMTGVLTYPFQARVFPVVLGLAMAWTFLLLVGASAWMLEGMAAVAAPIILAATAFAGFLLLVPTLSTLQKVMENSSNGDDESDVRPNGGLLNVFESLSDAIPLIIAAALSCVPTMGVVQLAGLPKPFDIGAMFAAYMLFPVILLSMLENDSMLGVFSKNIWTSIAKVPGAWFKFASIAAGLFALGVGTVVALVTFDVSRLGNSVLLLLLIVAAFVLLCAVTIYFRLLGRLAFVLSQKVWIEVSDKPQNESVTSEDFGPSRVSSSAQASFLS